MVGDICVLVEDVSSVSPGKCDERPQSSKAIWKKNDGISGFQNHFVRVAKPRTLQSNDGSANCWICRVSTTPGMVGSRTWSSIRATEEAG